MALVKCYECGAEISSIATHCPKCGAPQKKTKKCYECGAEIAENLQICPECGAPQPKVEVVNPQPTQTTVYREPASYPQVNTPSQQVNATSQTLMPVHPKDWLAWSILSIISGSLILGIWAIVKSTQVNRLYDSGRYMESESASQMAFTLNLINTILIVLIVVICLVVIALG